MSERDIYWNHSDTPIFICTKWHADPLGGPAIQDVTTCVAPGQGIDVTVLGLKRDNPKDPMCEKCRMSVSSKERPGS
jgi:hypothetical protein